MTVKEAEQYVGRAFNVANIALNLKEEPDAKT